MDQNEISVPSPDKRLPIAYEHKGVVIRNAFMDRAGKFTDPNDEFLDICYNNLTWAVFHIFKWKGKPLALAPFQSVILQALWDKTFPLLVASRGAGKTWLLGLYAALHALLVPGSKVVIVSNSFRQSKLVFDIIEELYNQSPIFAAACNGPPLKPNDSRELRVGDSTIKAVPLGNGEKIRGLRACVEGDTLIDTSRGLIDIKTLVESGQDFTVFNGEKYVEPTQFVRTPVVDTHEVSTMYGYRIRFSDIHKIWTKDGWKDINELTTNDRVPIYINEKFTSEYVKSPKFSEDKITHNDYIIPEVVDENVAKILGYLVSEGCVTHNSTISFNSSDTKLLNDYIETFEKCFGVKPTIYQKNEENINSRGWKCKASYEAKICRLGIRNYLEKIGLARVTAPEKKVPWSILQSPKSVVNSFLSSLIDGDGSVVVSKNNKRGTKESYVTLYSASEKLCRDVQILYLKLGVYTSLSKRDSKISTHKQFSLKAGCSYGSRIVSNLKLVSEHKIKAGQEMLTLYPPNEIKTRFLKVNSIIKKAKKTILYDFYIPDGNAFIGNGFKNHNTVIISDETASVPPEIFQIVVRGFAAVSADPIEMAKKLHEEDLLVKSGALRADQRTRFKGNKIIYAGTANFQFNHFYKIYSVHKAIIEKKLIGAASELYKEYAMEGDGDEEIDFRDYAIIQLPYFAIPKGFMDERQISQGKATMPRALFEMEYCCVFPTDSDGFFRRSAINDSTPGFNKIGKAFGVEFKGDPAYEYVMGIDPARKSDNFAISILKLMGDGTYKNVYCCSLNRKSYVDAVAKIRELLKKFNIVRIAMDAGGGGTAVEDLLQTGCGPGELPIWRWNEDEHRPYTGLHILEIVNFVPSWIRDANHGLASDIEHKKLLFPYRTPEQDIGDQEEEVHAEIDEQINEMVNIVITRTKSGVEHFDMPDMSQNSTLNVIQRKDRYSALLLSTYAARSLLSEEKKEIVPFAGGWLDSL